MKKVSIIVLVFSFLSFQQAFAQMSKGELKEWKTKLKDLGPEGLKELTDENEGNKVKVTNLEARVTNLEQEKGDLKQELQDLKDALARKEAQVKEAEAKAAAAAVVEEPTETMASTTPTTPSTATTKNTTPATKTAIQKGVVFKVQIGSFKKVDITKYFNRNKNFSGDVDEDGTMKYTLGMFDDYWEADAFKKYLRAMGVKDAWIVAYKDGKRANIKDVLEGQ